MNRKLRRNMPMTFAEATAGGWSVSVTGSGHTQLRRDGHIVTCPSSPSCPRSDKNTRSLLRRCERGVCTCRTAIQKRAS